MSFEDGSERVDVKLDDAGNPINKNGWSANGVLSAGGENEVSMQAVFEDKPDTYTLQFNMIRNAVQDPAPGAVRAEALVTWSVEGNSVQRRVTIGNGTALTGVAQGVKVSMKDVSVLLGGAPGPFNEKYIVTAQVTKGGRATGSNPPTLQTTDPVEMSGGTFQNGVEQVVLASAPGPADVATWNIPKNAGVVAVKFLVFNSGGGAPLTKVGDLAVSHNTNGASSLCTYDPVIEDDWVPVIPGTDSVSIQNLSGNTYFAQLIWAIEG